MRDIYDIETEYDAISVFSVFFGGFPYYLFMGTEEDVIIDAVVKALETDSETEAEDGAVYSWAQHW